MVTSDEDAEARGIAARWCEKKGSDWKLGKQLGRGGTAPVFGVQSPAGPLALKIYDSAFSSGSRSDVEEARVASQVHLGLHSCGSLVRVHDGGRFEGRLFLVMNRAPGAELEKVLDKVPRDKIRGIVDQVASAAAFLHDKGLCHRDIKSANVFVSDDFNNATLLDLSVTRGINDPIGQGTDHDGQLPVVATARYSPPEYLFRLVEPGPELWHALDVYQLGALLHDLIMRKPLFQEEYAASKENRYKFAWTVATHRPVIDASDVDADLLLLARRALDKDWKRRSALKIDSFYARSTTGSLELLGLREKSVSAVSNGIRRSDLRAVLQRSVTSLEDSLVQSLRALSVTPKHWSEPGADDLAVDLFLSWLPDSSRVGSVNSTELRLQISVCESGGQPELSTLVTLTSDVTGTHRESSVRLPPFGTADTEVSQLAGACMAILPELARRIAAADTGG
jgi:serine/threonine protein kinase